MFKTVAVKTNNSESYFFKLYKIVQEREAFLSNDAKITQYGALLRYFMKFLQYQDEQSVQVGAILYQIYIKLGDIYYEEALQNQDNRKYFWAAEYFNQALVYAKSVDERIRVLIVLKDIYYYIGDEEAFFKVGQDWAENHDNDEKFRAYLLLAQNTEQPYIKIKFLERALDLVTSRDESFYIKYQNTLDICSQLLTLYEIVGDKEKIMQIKNLRENTFKLLN